MLIMAIMMIMVVMMVIMMTAMTTWMMTVMRMVSVFYHLPHFLLALIHTYHVVSSLLSIATSHHQHALHLVFRLLPKSYDEAGRDLVERLLRLEPERRLGAGGGGGRLAPPPPLPPPQRTAAASLSLSSSGEAIGGWAALKAHPFFAATNLSSTYGHNDVVRLRPAVEGARARRAACCCCWWWCR